MTGVVLSVKTDLLSKCGIVTGDPFSFVCDLCGGRGEISEIPALSTLPGVKCPVKFEWTNSGLILCPDLFLMCCSKQ